MRERGTVQRWLGAYGFIMPLSSGGKGGAIFIHHRDIERQGYRELFPGDLVEFEIEEGERGRHATHCKVIKSADPAETAA